MTEIDFAVARDHFEPGLFTWAVSASIVDRLLGDWESEGLLTQRVEVSDPVIVEAARALLAQAERDRGGPTYVRISNEVQGRFVWDLPGVPPEGFGPERNTR
ncbi:hypothetical protein [Kitasatospora sp. NPDC093679]|uniref:hypothetical protein n=1 Tax=Kitasatospora sp. NPDC093679 TaxID=3154983 RepID=UPI003420CFDB